MAVNIIALLTKLCKRVKVIEDTFITKGMYQYLCDAKTVATTDANNNNASVSKVCLVGNVLRGYFTSSNLDLGAGDISNSQSHIYYVNNCFGSNSNLPFDLLVAKSFWSGSTGGVVTYGFSDSDQDIYTNSIHYTVDFCSTHAATTSSNTYYWLVASMNSNYDFSNTSL